MVYLAEKITHIPRAILITCTNRLIEEQRNVASMGIAICPMRELALLEQ
jgi:hypothetical protein